MGGKLSLEMRRGCSQLKEGRAKVESLLKDLERSQRWSGPNRGL